MLDKTAWLFFSLGLLFVFEGFLPAVNPKFWKQLITNITDLNDNKIRVFGLFSMVIGAIIIAIVHQLYKV